jgi:hypothetical protein
LVAERKSTVLRKSYASMKLYTPFDRFMIPQDAEFYSKFLNSPSTINKEFHTCKELCRIAGQKYRRHGNITGLGEAP